MEIKRDIHSKGRSRTQIDRDVLKGMSLDCLASTTTCYVLCKRARRLSVPFRRRSCLEHLLRKHD